MTIPAPVIVPISSVRIRWCALCLGAIVFCASWGGAGEANAQGGRLSPANTTGVQDRQLPTSGAAGVAPTLSAVLLKRGGLTLRDTPLTSALFTISEIWKVNLVVGQEVQGKVNGVFRDAPLYEILDSILLSNGYGYRPVGHSLVVMPLEGLGDLNPMFQSATITLQNTDPAEIIAGVRLLSSPQGKIEAVPSAKSLMVLDFPDRVARIRQLVNGLDQAAGKTVVAQVAEESGPLDVAQISPQFVAASSLLAAVQTLLSKEGKAAVVEPDGRLVVTDYQAQINLVRKLVTQLDVPRQQVRITALIYDLDVQDIERLGISWNHALKYQHDSDGNPQSVWNINSLLSVPVSPGLPNGTMTFMNLSRHFDITAIVQALQQAQDSRLLANPNVTVLDHEEAMISIVTKIPYQELTQTQQGGQIGTTAFEEAGITLRVTPHIAIDGTIRMKVSPSFSRLTGFTPGEPPQPIIDSREAQTTVRVTDRQVLVIGGLRKRNDTGDFNGLPYLKDIKAFNLGALFRNRDTEVRESELVVFIMPEIVPTAHTGACREDAALQYGQCLLNQVPAATGGRPPHRPVPRCPPTPIGGPRVLGTPYQPETCPPPWIEINPETPPPNLPGEQIFPVPDSQGTNDRRDRSVEMQTPEISPVGPQVRRLPPTAMVYPPYSGSLRLSSNPPLIPRRPSVPPRESGGAVRIVGVRAIPPQRGEVPAPWRRSYREQFRGSAGPPSDR